jgi:lipopolysaccharide biosynthesis glycosyltransferase
MRWFGSAKKDNSHRLEDATCAGDLANASARDQQVSSSIDLPRSAVEKHADRYWPSYQQVFPASYSPPPEDVCFLTVADFRFYRGLEALLLSLLAVYPSLRSPIYIIHDGTLGPYLQNRLLSLYPNLDFRVPTVSWTRCLPKNSANRKRIGVLGYLNTVALSLRGFKRVIALDSDLLIEGPLDPLWANGDQFRLAPDCGVRPWTPISSLTQRPVLNSGVISIPGRSLSGSEERRMASLIENSGQPSCAMLDRFADQKVWNLFLADQSVELLPINYNCNSKYLFRHLSGISQGLSVIHFAGPKPWLTWPWFEPSPNYLDAHPSFPATCWLWNDRYCRLLAAWRSRLYFDAVKDDVVSDDKGHAVISNSFEWLLEHRQNNVSLHLLISDASVFGGFTTDAPCWPEQWIEILSSVDRLHLWMPYELEPLIRHLPQIPCVRIHWLLIEAPFSAEVGPANDRIQAEKQSVGYDPLSLNRVESMAHTVRQRLEQAGSSVEVSMIP